MNKMKEYAVMRKAQLAEQIAQMEYPPTLLIIQVGDNEASNRYVHNKMKDCDEVGITAHHLVCDESIITEELIDCIATYGWKYDGIIVQQPLPKHIDQARINEAIDPAHDVDGFHPLSHFNPATAKGIIDYLDWRNFELIGADVVVIGRSDIVGKPLARMLTDRDATVTLCHSKTPHQRIMVDAYDADLVICAVGKPRFLDYTFIDGSVIDVGINFDEDGKMCGDCYSARTDKPMDKISPVPGGVGLLTRVALLENVVEAANE